MPLSPLFYSPDNSADLNELLRAYSRGEPVDRNGRTYRITSYYRKGYEELAPERYTFGLEEDSK